MFMQKVSSGDRLDVGIQVSLSGGGSAISKSTIKVICGTGGDLQMDHDGSNIYSSSF